MKGTDQPLAADFFNIRQGRISAPGICLYVQSGDPTDFDGERMARLRRSLIMHGCQVEQLPEHALISLYSRFWHKGHRHSCKPDAAARMLLQLHSVCEADACLCGRAGYYIAAAGAVVARHTPDCKFVVVVSPACDWC